MEQAEKKPNAKPAYPIIGFLVLVGLGLGVYFLFFGGSPRTAKKRFADTYTCPADRIELRERKDIKGSMFVTHEPPPDEVKNDPERFAQWKKKQDEADADADDGGNYGVFYYEVRGCDHQQLYECSNKPSCTERKYPDGVKPSW